MPINAITQLSGALRNAFEHPDRGVVGLVDELLRSCSESDLQIDWELDVCRIRTVANGMEEVLEQPVSKYVFRAVLARVAAMCNERSPASVTPYGGSGELVWGAGKPVVFKATFVNTSERQKLELVPAPPVRE